MENKQLGITSAYMQEQNWETFPSQRSRFYNITTIGHPDEDMPGGFADAG